MGDWNLVIQDTNPLYIMLHALSTRLTYYDTILRCLLVFFELEVIPPILVYESYVYLLVYMFIM